MRGTGQKPQTPTGNYINPIYKEPEDEKPKEESRQSEPKKLPIIIPEISKIKIARDKIKSLTPRSKTPRENIVTLMPSRPENVLGGLTKIQPPATEAGTINLNPGSSGTEVFPRITPRPQFTTEELTLRARNKPSPPLAPTRGKAASTGGANLGAVVPSRKKRELPASKHSWETPVEDAEEREQEHIDLMPLISEKQTGGLTKIKPPTLFERPHDPQSPRSKLSMTLRRPIMEKKSPAESLDTTRAEEDGIEDLGKISRIELVEVHRTFTADEHAALLEKKKTLANLGPQARRSVLPSTRTNALQVTKSIGFMIRELNEPGSASKRMRALNILFCVARGESFVDPSLHPEIELLAEYLRPLSAKEKFAFLKHLHTEVKEHLDPIQQFGLQQILDEMETLQRHFVNLTFLKLARDLEIRLKDQAADETETQH